MAATRMIEDRVSSVLLELAERWAPAPCAELRRAVSNRNARRPNLCPETTGCSVRTGLATGNRSTVLRQWYQGHEQCTPTGFSMRRCGFRKALHFHPDGQGSHHEGHPQDKLPNGTARAQTSVRQPIEYNQGDLPPGTKRASKASSWLLPSRIPLPLTVPRSWRLTILRLMT